MSSFASDIAPSHQPILSPSVPTRGFSRRLSRQLTPTRRDFVGELLGQSGNRRPTRPREARDIGATPVSSRVFRGTAAVWESERGPKPDAPRFTNSWSDNVLHRTQIARAANARCRGARPSCRRNTGPRGLRNWPAMPGVSMECRGLLRRPIMTGGAETRTVVYSVRRSFPPCSFAPILRD